MNGKPKAWLGIDPGMTGAIALIDEDDQVIVADWLGALDMHKTLMFWMDIYDIQMAMLERVSGRKGNSAKSNTTFMRHVGEWVAILRLCELPWAEVLPTIWMKRRLPAKKDKDDKPSLAYVRAKYPDINLIGPRGGPKDGRSDAVCIAEFAREKGKL